METIKAPVLFLVFNRPYTTVKVLEAIRLAKPSRLYVAADGPRKSKEGEAKVVQNVRKLILDKIDWDCEVKTLFREKNLGCKSAVNGAIDWFFENEEMGIILEDDCLPDLSFFNFCQENLERYKEDNKVYAITGDNFMPSKLTNESYFFSRFIYIWGWATWRRSWFFHKNLLLNYDNILKNITTLNLNHNLANKKIIENAKSAYNGKVDTWDYQWILSGYLNNGLIITPCINLVKNIGCDKNATHTKFEDKKVIIENNNVQFPLIHPKIFIPNQEYDNFLFDEIFRWKSKWLKLFDFKDHPERIKNKLCKFLR